MALKHGRHLSFSFEIAYSVADYLDKDWPEDTEKAFDACQNIKLSILRQDGLAWLIDEIELLTTDELVTHDILLTEIEFVEFDSPNWTHASGYFGIDVYCASFGYAKELEARYENHINK